MSQKIKIAINGFGRIGRAAFKIALSKKNLQVAAINDLSDNKTLAHLLKYDSIYGILNQEVKAGGRGISVNGKLYPVFNEKDPSKLPWKKLGIDVVLECTGVFTDEAGLKTHLIAGAKKAILSAPAKGGGVGTFVLGVNDAKYKGEKILNNASCTTNCIAPVAAIIHGSLGIVKASMTTIHAYTQDQRLHDAPHKDLRRARAAAVNIVPTTTGAALAATEAIPELKGLFDGLSIRVPVTVGSLSDFTMIVKRKTSVEEINKLFIEAAKSKRWKGIVRATNEQLVSTDIIKSTESTIVDLSLTQVIAGDMVKVIAWYDNEWGYSNRLVEMAEKVSAKGGKK